MARASIANVVGFDDAPFARSHRGDVSIVGALFAAGPSRGVRRLRSTPQLVGVLHGKVRRDGRNATDRIAQMLSTSRFRPQLHLIMLQGIAVAGFNVIDIHHLHGQSGLPVLVVARKRPNMEKIRRALLRHVPSGARKWQLIENAGPMEPLAGLYVQRAGLCKTDSERAIQRFRAQGTIPEPLRTAHLIAGGIASGESRGRT